MELTKMELGVLIKQEKRRNEYKKNTITTKGPSYHRTEVNNNIFSYHYAPLSRYYVYL